MFTTISIILVVLGVIALVMAYNLVGWVLIAIGVIVFIVKLVKGKASNNVTPPPAQPMA